MQNTTRYCARCFADVNYDYVGKCPWCHFTRAGIVPPYYEREVGGESDKSSYDHVPTRSQVGRKCYLMNFGRHRKYLNEDENDNPWNSYAVRVWEDAEAKEEMSGL